MQSGPIPLLHTIQSPSGSGIGVAIDADHTDLTGAMILLPLKKRDMFPVLGKGNRILYQKICGPVADSVIGGMAKHHILINFLPQFHTFSHLSLTLIVCST